MIRRFATLARRARRLSSPAGGPVQAFMLMRQMQHNPHAVQTILVGNREVSFRRIDEASINEVLFENAYDFCKSYLAAHRGATVLDVGANVGAFSIWTSAICPTANVIAIEANETVAEIAQSNLARLGQYGGKWQALHRAASKSDDEQLFVSDTIRSDGNRISQVGGDPVRGISLRSLVNACGGHVDLAKIDIEGSEAAFLAGAGEVLSHIAALIVELHPALCDTDGIERTLYDAFPRIDVMSGPGSKPLLFCRR